MRPAGFAQALEELEPLSLDRVAVDQGAVLFLERLELLDQLGYLRLGRAGHKLCGDLGAEDLDAGTATAGAHRVVLDRRRQPFDRQAMCAGCELDRAAPRDARAVGIDGDSYDGRVDRCHKHSPISRSHARNYSTAGCAKTVVRESCYNAARARLPLGVSSLFLTISHRYAALCRAEQARPVKPSFWIEYGDR
jgi:hypothetical protein